MAGDADRRHDFSNHNRLELSADSSFEKPAIKPLDIIHDRDCDRGFGGILVAEVGGGDAKFDDARFENNVMAREDNAFRGFGQVPRAQHVRIRKRRSPARGLQEAVGAANCHEINKFPYGNRRFTYANLQGVTCHMPQPVRSTARASRRPCERPRRASKSIWGLRQGHMTKQALAGSFLPGTPDASLGHLRRRRSRRSSPGCTRHWPRCQREGCLGVARGAQQSPPLVEPRRSQPPP